MGVVTNEQLSVATDGTSVVLSVGIGAICMGYETALNIARMLRIAGNIASRVAGIPVGERAELKRQPVMNGDYVSPHRKPADATGLPWRIDVDGEQVILQIGGIEMGFEGHDALTISAWLRHRGKAAKSIAGDKSRAVVVSGFLSDAEENYRLGTG